MGALCRQDREWGLSSDEGRSGSGGPQPPLPAPTAGSGRHGEGATGCGQGVLPGRSGRTRLHRAARGPRTTTGRSLMSDQDIFERLLGAFSDTMLDETLWPATSALIDEACGLRGNAMMIGEGPQDDIQALFVGLYYRGQRRADLERAYLEGYHPIDELVPRVRRLPASHLVHVPTLYTTAELRTSPAYNEMLRRVGGQEGVIVRLDGLEDSHLTWITSDPVTRGGWTSPQLALLRGLLPHLRQLVRVRQTLARAEVRGASATALLDTARVGVIHLDRRGRIVEANDRARGILRRGDGVVDRGGELSARVPADHARLARLVAGTLPAAGPTAVSGSMTLRRPAGGARFVVHVLPVGVGPLDFGGQRVAALVLIVEPGRQSRLDLGLVATALDLTLTESQIAVWLAAGQSVREIAGATGRQASSIRWHLKQIYRKQGLAGQTDLVRLVLSLAAFA